MADEFAKGFTIFSAGATLWMILAGWYRTHEFDGPQFTGPLPDNPGTFDSIGIVVMDAVFWFMILGTLTFWFVIPAFREARAAYADRNAE
jgi:hypothetical protein